MKHFTYSVGRFPLLPFDILQTIQSDEQLLEKFNDPVLKEALYLASPALYDEFLKNKPDEKLIASLTKYLQRAATRCTPFALFASCSANPISEINMDNESCMSNLSFNQRRHTRLDMNYLCALAQKLSLHPHIQPHLIFYPNTSIYKVLSKIRYTEYKYMKSNRKHQLSTVDSNPYLDHILKAAKNGCSIHQLIESVFSSNDDFGDLHEISTTELENFIHEMIEAQLLVSNIEPAVSGKEFMDQILEILIPITHPEIVEIKNTLIQVQAQLKNIDQSSLGVEVSLYKEIGEQLKVLGVDFDWKYLFQTDLFRDSNLVVDQRLSDQIIEAINVLGKLSMKGESQTLKQFKDAFYARYEDKEVSFIEALDSENGLGYPYTDNKQNDLSPMVDKVFVGYSQSKIMDLKWSPVDQLLLKKITQANKDKSLKIELTETDISSFEFSLNSLPDTVSAMANITSYNSIDDEYTIQLSNAGGSSAVNLLGRFCHGDPKINEFAMEITAKEEELNPDIILAEIVHLPESRIGNIALRPLLRKYEIPYLAKNGVNDDFKIELQDLMISIKNNKLLLRSKKFNKYVIPKLGNAHNYSFNSLPMYHFLCELQNHYQQSGVGINMSFFESQFDFLPRVTYKNFIFSPAIWTFQNKTIESMFKLQKEELLLEVRKWREKYSIPKHMLLPEGDNQLYIDWENPLSIRCLWDAIKKKESIKLTEFLFNTDQPYIKTKDGSFTNQFIFSYYQESRQTILPPIAAHGSEKENSKEITRHFYPGSEWMYLKIYTGVKTADDILTSELLNLTKDLKNTEQIDKFFFIRYADPKQHFRFRLLTKENTNKTDILKRIHIQLKEFIENGLISNIQLEPYNREVERYGDKCIELTESLFEIDSELCLNILSYLEGDTGDEIRWKIGLLIIDSYFTAFGLGLDERIQFTDRYKNNFEQEFNIQKDHRNHIAGLYRENRGAIGYILGKKYISEDECTPLYDLVNEYTSQINSIANQLYGTSERIVILQYLGSYIHMSVNRFFRSKQRLHELIIYSYLHKYYKSQIAIFKKKQPLLSDAPQHDIR